MNIVLIGSVCSSLRTLKKLIEHQLPPVAVFGYQADDVSHISGYEDLEPPSREADIAFHAFRRINEQVDAIKQYKPDLLFVVGLSQLVSTQIIDLPTHGCVGFHPTALPLGRGRAPVAWILLDDCPGAASFFRIAEGADDGPIFVQEPYQVDQSDDAGSVTQKLLEAADKALDRWIPDLQKGIISAIEQDHTRATYYGKRIESDGQLAWHEPAIALQRLVRATTRPYPGAFTCVGDIKIRIWNATVVACSVMGVPGSIVDVDSDGGFTVQTGHGHLRIEQYNVEGEDWAPVVDARFDASMGLSWPHRA